MSTKSKENQHKSQHHLSDSELSKWSGVGEVTLNEAANLWCETRPPDKPTIKDFRNPETWWPLILQSSTVGLRGSRGL
jgi:hypothetical protein